LVLIKNSIKNGESMEDLQNQNQKITDKIREISTQLLEEKEVDLIIGYSDGTFPLSNLPVFIREVDEVEKLIWNNLCYVNLASYLTSNISRFIRKEESEENLKIGLVAKGCVARTIIQLSLENQIDLNDIILIGINCNGIINRKRIEKEIGEREITNLSVKGGDIIVEGKDFEEEFPFDEYLMELCKVCKIKAPPQLPELSENIRGDSQDISDLHLNFDDIKEFEEKSPEERWEYINDLLQSCTRCYACREVCPFCYCNLCFVDQNMPQWFGKTAEIPDIISFHLIRALHLAGRCVGCGSCSSVCPVGIDLSLINRKIEEIVKERFNFVSGADLTTILPMNTHDMDDNQNFMLEEEG